MAAAKAPAIEVPVGDRIVRVSNPDRIYFPALGLTKLDLVEYYLSIGDGVVNALRERPCMLHRFPKGIAAPKVHQKRVPAGAPPWVETVRLFFPRYGQHADELCVTELAQVIWAVQMSTVEFHPWNSRRAHTEQPDEWRIDLDPMPWAPALPTITPYQVFAANGFTDTWLRRPQTDPGLTCCQAETLDNRAPVFTERIDLIFSLTPPRHVLDMRVLGERIGDKTRPAGSRTALWPSDHASVAARLQFD
jgi:hypothetical protein